MLRPLSEESAVIDEAVSKLTEEQRAALNPGVTSYDWFSRRIKNQRIKNRTVSYIAYLRRLTPLICSESGSRDVDSE